MNEWLLSRRDRLIIARHEYVFSALLNRPGRPWYPIIPYPTGRFFRGTLSQALRARLRSVLSLRDALADISPQHLASGPCPARRYSRWWTTLCLFLGGVGCAPKRARIGAIWIEFEHYVIELPRVRRCF